VLGGVDIAHDTGLDGHSDADVLLHAVMDALLGAAGLGDIGRHFPNTDAQWKDASSLLLLTEVSKLIGQQGWIVGNIDATVIAEAPRLLEHVPAMKRNIAGHLHIQERAVNIKATTAEGTGPEGRREAISAHAVALLYRS